MVILGIDPGIATVGFGAIDAVNGKLRLLRCGVVTTPSNLRLARRLKQIYGDIQEIIRLYSPDCMVVEELFFNTNLKTAVSVAHGRGVAILAGETRGVTMYEYTPLQVKQAVTGYGRADKKQVMDMVRRLLSMDSTPKPDDAADALAVAICHAHFSGSLINIGGGDKCSTI
jgi:crossover junction endodeoxyribonuclease RuvC